jgi:phosphate transport system permease protein
MPVFWLFLIVLAVATIGFVVGRSRGLATAGGDSRKMKYHPVY